MNLTLEIEHLFNEQFAVWSQAASNHEALSDIKTRRVDIDETHFITLQHNPARIISSGAKLDKTTISNRPCFLCVANRPKEQIAVKWRGYDILVNPYPIFPHHLTIAAHTHSPQLMKGRMHHLTDLAHELPEYTIFYNGAGCGASAPDHAHFQAAPSVYFPIWEEISRMSPVVSYHDFVIYDRIPATCVAGDTDSAERIMEMLPHNDRSGEPMVNILCRSCGTETLIVIIPRRKHRPDNFNPDAKDPSGVMISPGAIDVAGLTVTPRLQDFTDISAPSLAEIYSQVGYHAKDLIKLFDI